MVIFGGNQILRTQYETQKSFVQCKLDPQYFPITSFFSSWWFQPGLKNISQLGSSPQVRVRIK